MNDRQAMIHTVDRVYAQALLNIVWPGGQAETVAQELADLAGLLSQQPALAALLGSRVIGQAKRAASIEKIFASRVSEPVYRFLMVLNRRHRSDRLAGIAQAFQTLLDEKRGLVPVQAWTATTMDESEIASLADRLSRAIDRPVTLTHHSDASLIGGLKLRLGDQLLDGSLAAQLRLMKRKLTCPGASAGR